MNFKLNKDCMHLDCEFADKEEAFKFMSYKLEENGYVKDTFYKNLIEREKKYPTGLDTNGVKVAIPHTDSEHVLETTLSIAILKNPVNFSNMADNQQILPIKIIIMLAIKNPKDQIDTLSQLMKCFTEKEKLLKLYNSKNKVEIIDFIKENME